MTLSNPRNENDPNNPPALGFPSTAVIIIIDHDDPAIPFQSEEAGCFGTFICGSNHPYVQKLRDFWDKYLMTHPMGRAFVQTYYLYSPDVTAILAEHESLKIGARMALTLVVYTIVYPPSYLWGSFYDYPNSDWIQKPPKIPEKPMVC